MYRPWNRFGVDFPGWSIASPIPAEKVSANEYVPLYSYTRTSAFRHTDKAGLTADVATKATSRVAAN